MIEERGGHSFWNAFGGANAVEKVSLTISSWFFCGLVPGAPGTFGTAAAVVPAFFLGYLPILWRGLIVASFTGLAIISSSVSASTLKQEDPSVVVIDEVAGYLLAVLLLPQSVVSLGLVFIFFRLFDILKPFPIRQIERKVRGGVGIVLDDLIAGILAFLLVKAILVLGQAV